MRVVLSGYFDAGFGIGIDDSPFDEARRRTLVCPEGFVGESQELKSPFPKNYLYDVKLGQGLCFDLTGSPEFYGWCEDALSVCRSDAFREDYYMSAEGQAKLSQFPVDRVKYIAMLTLYACGIGCVEIVFDNLPEEDFNAEASARFVQAFEVASYGLFGSNGDFQAKLQDKCMTILGHFVDEKNTDVKQSMFRMPEKRADNFSYNFFPSFTILFFPQRTENAESIRQFFEITHTKFTTVSLNGIDVWCSWYIFITPLEVVENSGTLAWVVRMYNLFYGICQAHSILLTARISRLFFNMSQMDKGDLDKLIKLRITSCVFANYTHTYDLCQNEEILGVFSVLDNGDKLSAFHKSMQDNVDILNNIQNQIDQTAEKLKEEHSKKQEGRLNKFIAIITTLTFISVIADFFSLDERSSEYIPFVFIRIILYACVLAFIFIGLFYSFGEKK